MGRLEAGSVRTVEAVIPKIASAVCTRPASRQVLKTIYSSLQPYTPEDGHNGARNMLSHWFINKS